MLDFKIIQQEQYIEDMIPVTHAVDHATLATPDGSLLQVIKLNGFAHETAEEYMIAHYKKVRASNLRSISNNRFVFYHHIIRKVSKQKPEGFYDEGFCKQYHDAYTQKLNNSKMFVNEHYITILLRPRPGVIGLAERAFRAFSENKDKEAHLEEQQLDLKRLHDATKFLLMGLQDSGAELLTMEGKKPSSASPLLSFFSHLTNGQEQPIAPDYININKILPQKRVSFGNDTFEIRGARNDDIRLGTIVSIKNYSSVTGPGMLDCLLTQPHEFILTQTYQCLSTKDGLKGISDRKNQLANLDDGADILLDQVSHAKNVATSGAQSWGLHHIGLKILASDQSELDEALNSIVQGLENLYISMAREDLNMEHLYWAQIPGNLKFIARKAQINNDNYASLASYHNFAKGKETSYWGEALTCFETTSGTPYWFNIHHGDTAGLAVFGSMGKGKTALISHIHAQTQKYKPRSFIFDKDRGMEIYVRAIGGEYSSIVPGEPANLNPLQLEDTPENRAFLESWLKLLIQSNNKEPLTTQEQNIIHDTVIANYQMPKESRQLCNLYRALGGINKTGHESLIDRISPWHSGGEKAWLFDNAQDAIPMGCATLAFDMTSILQDPVSRTPWMYYIFHRIKTALVQNARNGEKTMIIIDEAWQLFDDEIFANEVEDWLRTIRKKNGCVIFATQGLDDALTSKVGKNLIKQTPTQIFLPEVNADRKTYCEEFSLTKEELLFIRETPVEKRCFLIKQGHESTIAKLDLAQIPAFIPVLSGRLNTLPILERLRQQNPNPSVWIPQFMKETINA